MRVSFSSISDWRTCQQLYAYRYLDGVVAPAPPAVAMGRILHHYLETFYSHANARGVGDAHGEAKAAIVTKYQAEIDGLVYAAQAAGMDATGLDYQDMLAKAQRIADRYYRTRGEGDASEEVLFCEHKLVFPLTPEIDLAGIADLVTRRDGVTALWEHKTTISIPPQTRRLKDLQILLLAVLLEEAAGVHIDEIVWNYMRTTEPTVPERLKNGELSVRKDLDTTWDTYLEQIAIHNLEVDTYLPLRERLAEREERIFFPRMVLPIMQRETVLLRDFIATAREVDHAISSDDFMPVRNVSRTCDWCSYSRLCEAAILG